MEIQELDKERDLNWKKLERTHKRGKIMGGLLIIGIGSLFLAKELGADIPFWLLSWKMLLIAIGVVIAIKHKFMHPGWIILIAVGGAFLLNDIYPEMQLRPFLWPVLMIMIGLFILFKPRHKHWHHKHRKHHMMRENWKNWKQHQRNWHENQNVQDCSSEHDYFAQLKEEPTNEEYINSTACFAGVKKNILTKKFRGGDITNIFGGTELNLMQADIEDKANLEITQVFGGTKLIVPAHWEIKSEIVAILGSVEDKRPVNPSVTNNEPAKVLVLVGTTVLGGIEIRSY